MSTVRRYPAVPLVGAAGRPIVSPLQYELDGTDALRIVCANSASGVVVTIAGYRLDEHGVKHPFVHTVTPTTDRAATVEDLALGAGALMNLTAFVSSGTPRVGQTFVVVHLIRGFTGATIVLGTLLSGYVTANQAMAWPGSPLARSTDGRGWIRTVTVAAVGASVDWTQSVPSGARWRVLSVYAELTTSVTAADRGPVLHFEDGATIQPFASIPPETGYPASQTWRICWAPTLSELNQTGLRRATHPIPSDLILEAGDFVETQTISLQAGDQWQGMKLKVEEWIDLQ